MLVASAFGIGFENALYFVTNPAKDRELILIGALCLGRIVKPPNGNGSLGLGTWGRLDWRSRRQ
jgi:hypothetical protein